MGRVIDDRVVEMRFDNKDFEKNVSQSLSTLDKLKSALKIGNSATSEFDNVMDAAGDLSNSFSALENIAVGAFRRMGAGIYEWAAKTIINLSGVGNVMEGWRKYEEITDAMATLHYQGYDDAKVEEQLRRLNWFTDETSYNLSDMVQNISKFTSRGWGLEDAADAMMGVALWAAMSGAGAEKASRAMYQLSQAGDYVKQMDWMSITNVGMDTKEVKQMFLETAASLDGEFRTLRKNADGTYTSLINGHTVTLETFSSSLADSQWLTTKEGGVLQTVLKKYSSSVDAIREYQQAHEDEYDTVSEVIAALREEGGVVDEWALSVFEAAQEARTWKATVDSVKDALSTGWMMAFQNIFGNYGEAKEFFTQLANDLYIFVEPINAFNEILENWKAAGGRADFISGLISLLHALTNILYMVGDAFSAVFRGKDTTKGLLSFSSGFKSIAGGLEEITEHMTMLKWTISGVFAAIDLALQPILGLIRAVMSLFGKSGKAIGYLNEGIFGLSGGIGWLLVKFDNLIKDGDIFYKLFTILLKPIELLRTAITKLVESVGDAVPKAWKAIKKFFAELGKNIYDALPGIWAAIKGYFKQLLDASGELGKDITKAFTKIGNKVKELWGLLKKADFSGFFDTVQSSAQVAAEKTAMYWEKAKPYIRQFFKDARDWTIEAVKTIGIYWTKAKKTVAEFYDIAKQKFYEVSGLKPGDFTSKIKEALAKAKETLLKFLDWAENNMGGFWSVIKKIFGEIAKFFGKIAGGIASFITSNSFEKPKKILKAFWETIKIIGMGIGAVFYGLYKLLEPILGDLKTLFHNLLTSTDMETVAGTLQGVGALFAGLGVSKIGGFFGSITETLNNFSGLLKGNPLKQAAKAILYLAVALFVLSQVPLGDLVKSEGAFMTIASFIGNGLAYMNKVVGGTNMLMIAKALKSMTLAMIMVAIAFMLLAKIPTKTLWNSVLVIIVLMSMMTIAMAALATFLPEVQKKGLMVVKQDPKGKKSHMLAGTILAIGLSLIMLAVALKIISTIDKGQMASALIGLLGAVIAIALVALAVSEWGKNLRPANASAFVLIAVSFIILAAAMKLLSTIDMADIGSALIGMLAVVLSLGILAVVISNFGSSFRPANGAAMLLLATSIIAIVLALQILAAMEVDALIKAIQGFIVIAAVMAILGIVFSKFPVSALAGVAMLAMGGAFILIAESLIILAGAVALFGKMDAGALKQGLIAVGLLVGGIALLSNLGNGGNMLALAVSLVIIGQALLILVGVITALGLMSIDTLKQGGIALAIFFGILIVAGLAATLVAPGLLVLSAAILALGAATLMTGLGLVLINKGFKSLYKNLHMIKPVVNGLFDGLLLFTTRLPELIEPITAFLTAMLVATLKAFTDNIPIVVEAIVEFITVVIETIAYGDGLERIADALWTIVETLLWTLEGHVQSIVDALANMLFDIALGIMEAFEDRIGELIDELLELWVAIIEGVADAIDENAKDFVDAVMHLKTAIFRLLLLAITGGYVDLYGAGEDGAKQTYEGFKTKIQNLFASIGGWLHQHLFKPIADWFVEKYEAFKSWGRNIWEGIKAGIEEALKNIKKWWNEKAIGWMPEEVRKFFEIASPSKLMARLGGYIMEGLGIGLSDGMSSPLGAVNSANNGILSGFTSLTDKINDLLNNNIETSPTITPVLDLTNLESESSSISSMFGGIDLGSGKANLAALASGIGTEDLGFDPNDPMSGRMVFNQYNYSPKALTPTEIYRQTRNQLSGAKGVVIQKR
jgi:hypothetical protein